MDKVYQDQIDEIMDWLDFKRVESVMKELNWRWASTKEDRPPIEPEIRAEARRLLRDLVDRKVTALGTGGFYASNDAGKLSLTFEVTRWEATCE